MEPRNNKSLTADDLKRFMNHHGISEREFAEILGVTIQAVTLWMNSKRYFSIANSRLIRMFDKYPQLMKEF